MSKLLHTTPFLRSSLSISKLLLLEQKYHCYKPKGHGILETCWACEGQIDFSNRNPFYRCFCEECAKTLDSDYKMAAFEAFRVGEAREAFLQRWSKAAY